MNDSFPISVEQIADLAGLRRGRTVPGRGFLVECPFCGDGSRPPKMLINTRLNAYKCPRCGEHGNVLDLYARTIRNTRYVRGVNSRELFREACRDLNLSDPVRASGSASEAEAAPAVQRAPDGRVHSVYRRLLEFPEFRLQQSHYRNLRKRGLSDEAIRSNGYRSFDTGAVKRASPDGNAWRETAARLEQEGFDLSGVPGFFREDGTWKFVLRSGLVIPVRNARQEIVGLQIRTDKGSTRYLTVSSAKYGGVNSRVCRVHFPLANDPVPPEGGDARMPKVILTEGPLKADTAIDLLRRAKVSGRFLFLAIPGVSIVNELPEIFRTLHARGVTAVISALDMDRYVNPNVAAADRNIRRLAEEAGLQAKTWLWGYKDIDLMWNACRKLLDTDLEAVSSPSRPSGEALCQALGDGTGSAARKACGMARFTALLPREELRSLPAWPERSKGIDDHLAAVLLSAPR